MKPELRFETKTMRTGEFGEPASVPDLGGKGVLQNHLEFSLEEDDEIYEGFGRRANSYPYPQIQTYRREIREREMKTAVLENDFLRAVFLPELGGRLWELTDKETGRNLLYTNDVIRFSNLAICNAWFSGGVEWNVSLIGHTPFTTRSLYTARLTMGEGIPVLRMYEYERVRGIEYQMDFWLEETGKTLNCRMRIVNSGDEVIPMYWWSNMAVPEYPGGRLIVPAGEAYSSNYQRVYKTRIPEVEGVDVTRYGNIPSQVDYFFNIPEENPRYIANIGEDGYGLLQYSTRRLRGRKLFSWGKKRGGHRWQEFLTEEAGPYVEIQAGLGKTQYGCVPMPPHSAWEWLERYGKVQINSEEQVLSFEELRDRFTEQMAERIREEGLEETLAATKRMAKTRGELVYEGCGYGAVAEAEREARGGRPLSEHLEYHLTSPHQESWVRFLKTGQMDAPAPDGEPGGFMYGEVFRDRLAEAVEGAGKENWYLHYQLGLLLLEAGENQKAEQEFLTSWNLEETAWACHALASLCLLEDRNGEAADWMIRGIRMRPEDLSYVKEGMRILLTVKGYAGILELYPALPEEIRQESRVTFDYYAALGGAGRWQEVYDFLRTHREFLLEDLRECEDNLAQLWEMACQELKDQKTEPVPEHWDFSSL